MNNNQEMEFADPAWQPQSVQDGKQEQGFSAPQPVWSPDVRPSQTDEVPASYAQGYQAQTAPTSDYNEPLRASSPPFQGQPQQSLRSQQPWPKRLPNWAWFLIAILVLGSIIKPAFSTAGSIIELIVLFAIGGALIWLISNGSLRINRRGTQQTPETRTFAVTAHPTVLIHNKAGNIRVHAGQEGQVSITTAKRGYLFSPRLDNDAQLSYQEDRADNRVTARVETWRPFGKNLINFEIVVPPQTRLELVSNAGSISVHNIDGQMQLRSDAGSITANQVTLHGQSRLRTNAGSITFNGNLDPAGDYELSTDFGSVNATLPADASFSLEAKTDLGSVSTNLPLVQAQKTKASGQVGNGPYPRLQVKTDLGSVHVYRG
ncbi:MAG: DUF4097 family beta strand repeat-containing protein [Ktedonobacteraceae bacterium]